MRLEILSQSDGRCHRFFGNIFYFKEFIKIGTFILNAYQSDTGIHTFGNHTMTLLLRTADRICS